MMVAAELADFYRKNFSGPARHRDAKAWVDAYPDNLAVVLLATTSASLEDVATAPTRIGEAIALDMMTLGAGAAEGTKLGIAQDVLRLLSVVPVGRVMRGASSVLAPFVGRIVQGGGQPCGLATYQGRALRPDRGCAGNATHRDTARRAACRRGERNRPLARRHLQGRDVDW
jgi:hypothetical protein